MSETQANTLLQEFIDLKADHAAARPLLPQASQVAVRYDRSLYDALFVALVQESGGQGVTADEPLYNAVHGDFPGIQLLRAIWPPRPASASSRRRDASDN